MYQCENTQGTILATKIVNTIMSSAISEILMDLIVNSKSFNEKDFEEMESSFLEGTNCPVKMKETLKKNKSHIINGLKQYSTFMPKGFTPQQTYELLCKTMLFVMDYSIIDIPPLEMEYIIGMSLRIEAEELQERNEFFYFNDIRNNKNSVKTVVETFCKFNHLEYTKEEFDEFIEFLKFYAKENKEFDRMDGQAAMYDYQYQLAAFKELITPKDIRTFSMYDEDYLMLQNYTVAEIQSSLSNELLGVVSEDESSMLGLCSDEQEER